MNLNVLPKDIQIKIYKCLYKNVLNELLTKTKSVNNHFFDHFWDGWDRQYHFYDCDTIRRFSCGCDAQCEHYELISCVCTYYKIKDEHSNEYYWTIGDGTPHI